MWHWAEDPGVIFGKFFPDLGIGACWPMLASMQYGEMGNPWP